MSAGLDTEFGIHARIGGAHKIMVERAAARRALDEQPFEFTLAGQMPTTTAQLSVPTVTAVRLPQSVPLGWKWELRHTKLLVKGQANISDQNGSIQIGQTSSGFTTVHAAAAAAGTLTANGFSYLSGFSVDPAAAWPAGDNLVTVTNLAGGTQTFEIPGGTTNSIRGQFPAPIAAPYASPVIAVPAIVGGPAYTINAWGIVLGSGFIDAAAAIFAGVPPVQYSATVSASVPQDVIEPKCSIPFENTYSAGQVVLKPADCLYAEAWNVIGGPVLLVARFLAYPDRSGRPVLVE